MAETHLDNMKFCGTKLRIMCTCSTINYPFYDSTFSSYCSLGPTCPHTIYEVCGDKDDKLSPPAIDRGWRMIRGYTVCPSCFEKYKKYKKY